MAENDFQYFLGSAVKYISLIGGASAFITSDSPHNYIMAGISGVIYFGGELLQKTARGKELENLEKKVNGVKKWKT